jgi:ATP-dependent Clp protease ATP-binding subunit ClpC
MTAFVSSRALETGEPELLAIRKLAEELAKGKTERTTTGHLLAAIASTPSPAADLLRERRLDAAVLLSAARVTTDDERDAIARAVQRAREFSARSFSGDRGRSLPAPTAMHLLFALCQERASAAHRALVQCGADVTKLRTAAMQLAMGMALPRRAPTTPAVPSLMQSAPGRKPPSASRPPPPRTGASPSLAPRPPAPAVRPEPGALLPHRGRRHRNAVQPAPPRPRPNGTPRSAVGTPPSDASGKNAPPSADRYVLDPKLFPVLSQLGRNLCLAAARGELEAVVGREEEVERTLDVLAKRRANSPCLIGAAGVGKTSVARGVAAHLAATPGDPRVLIELEPAALLAGTGVRGALAERLVQIKSEVAKADGRVILFLDDFHVLLSEGGDEGVSELKTALGKGELACVAATTEAEYKRSVLADAALARRFTPIEVSELSAEDAFLALEQIVPGFATHHGVTFSAEAIAASVTWSTRYMPGRPLPDKAIGILDLAGARAGRRSLADVGPAEIADVVSEMSGVPTERLLESDGDRMLRLEELMARRIVGHASALSRIARVLRRNASGFRGRRPIGSFLLLGPTGVGKTETAKAIAECLFHSPTAMTRLDLSEYAEPHSIARLVGAPPGYVGHESGGQLTEAVARRPYQVILLDEIEKAHRDVLEAFLQVFDEGHLTDGRGRTVDFTSTVILLTSNLGAEIRPARSGRGVIGFGGRGSSPEAEAAAAAKEEERVLAAAKGALPPELYNRFDEVIAFAPLTRSDVREVAARMLAALGEELVRTRGIRLDVAGEALDALLDVGGFDPEMGARPMRRAIGRLVETRLSEMLLRGEIVRGDVATVEVGEGELVIDVVKPTG